MLGPPDIESRIGLTGGNIFQGEVTPDQMWEGRFAARTPVEGLYMCGAATHPAGSVIALNGRNAASAVLAQARGRRVERQPATGFRCPRVRVRRPSRHRRLPTSLCGMRTRLTHNSRSPVTADVWAEDGVVHKLLTRRGEGGAGVERSDDERHWNYWKREGLAYESGLPAGLGLDAPRLVGVRERDDEVELRIEQVDGRHAEGADARRPRARRRRAGRAQESGRTAGR